MLKKYSLLAIMLLMICSGCGTGTGIDDADPVSVKIKFDKSKYTKDDSIKIVIEVNFMNDDSKSGKILLDADKPVTFVGQNQFEFKDIKVGKKKTFELELAKPFDINGSGIIKANLYTYNSSGDQLYYGFDVIYYLIYDEGVMLGEYSIDTLRRELDKQK